jgi:hypothetical protein
MRLTLPALCVFVLFPFYTNRESHAKAYAISPFRLHISNKLPNPLSEDPPGNNTIDTNAIKQSNWYADVVKNIEAGEYEIRKDDHTGLYVAPNRQQQLRTFFNYNSFTLQPRSKEENWILKMQLSGIYTDKKLIARPGEKDLPVTGSNKIVFNNAIFSTEYINSKEGIRQNFIIQKEPASKTQTIHIKLQTNKGWYINKVHDKELHFAKIERDQLSKKITYNSLKVWDANNKDLDAKFVVNKEHDAFEIEVNAEGAVYPITVDPVSTGTAGTPDWIGDDADQAGANFGINVGSAGDVNGDGYSDVIVGAFLYDDGPNTDEGRAFVYHGSATGLSLTPNSILDDADQFGANFGVSVNTAGDVNGDGYSDVIIGVHGYDDGANTNEGAAFVYHGSSSGLSSSPNIIIDDANQASAAMGFVTAVATAGDINADGFSDVIVGAYTYDDGANTDEGRAFVYYGSLSGLSASPDFILDDADQAGARFGISVASAGDVNGDGYSDVIVGAYTYDDVANVDEGRAFLYYGSASGLSSTPDAFLGDANQGGALFGWVVNSAGDVNGDGYGDVIIGAHGYDDGANTNEGAAFVYHGSASGISTSPGAIIDDADQASAALGIRAAGAGDVNGDGYSDVIVGIYFYDDGANTNEGRALIYFGSATGLPATPNAILDDGDLSFAELGSGAASAGDVNGDGYSDIIVGLWHYNDGANSQEGRAFVYHGSPNGLKTTAIWTAEGNQADVQFGVSVSNAGDVNGDGYSDVIVGAWGYDNGQTDEGRAYVYHGSAAGLSATSNWTAESNQANARFGVNTSGAGDVNGDGYSDIIVAATGFTNGEANEGRAFVYHGSASGLSLTPNWTAESNQAGAGYGVGVRSAGDINADGYSDVIIGAPWFDNGQSDEGAAFVYHGSSTGLSLTPNWTAESNQAGAYMGFNIGSAGDVNGDGYSDVIVGSAQYSNGQSGEGRAFVYHGSAIGLSATANWTAESNQASADFGINVSSAGDVNGDGYSDVIVGAENYTNGEGNEGRAFVYHGSATGLSLTPNWTAESNQASANFGFGVSSAGDVNGDGYSDVIIGAYNYTNGESQEGRAFVYHGSPTGLSAAANWTAESNQAGAQFGTHSGVACAGDVNGDGYSDVIVSAWFFDNGETDEGKVYLFYGNANGGLKNNLRLYNTDLVTPIQRFNYTEPNLFGAGLFSRSPLGRVKGKLVWEVKQQGQPFSGNPITNSTSSLGKQPSFTDLGIAGVELKYNVQKQGRQNKIRARVEYDKATAITGQVYGPWRYPPAYVQGAHGMNSVPLPVKLNSFTGALVAEKVKLQWISADDENVSSYQIERSSNNRDFTTIGNVSSIHQNNRSYNYIDDQPLKGKSWYRLKITDEYGRINYSGIIMIKNTPDAVSVYPTLISKGQFINLQFKNNITGVVEIQLINSSGAVVFKKPMTTNSNNLVVKLPALSSGVYILSAIQNAEYLITQKIIIR